MIPPSYIFCNLVRVVIDNESGKSATVIRVCILFVCFLNFLPLSSSSSFIINCLFNDDVPFIVQVDSANKHGILLEVVQILTDLNLIITKAYISSDGGWFMDGNTFNLT